jgi:type IV secretory pathway VirB6-like protein
LQSVVLYPSGANWNGLKQRITDFNIAQPFNSGVSGCSTIDVPSLWDKCHPVTDPGFSEYNLAGTLLGYSNANKSISLRHEEDGNYSFPGSAYNGLIWGDNLGGLTVKALWKGCPRYNGEGLQYAIMPDGSTGALSWQPVPMDAFTQGKGFAAPSAGRLYFRMQPPTVPTGVDVKGGDYQNQSSRFGQYKFTVSKYNYTSSCTNVAYGSNISNVLGGVISDIVNFVFTTMFGSPTDPSNPGVLANLFTALVQESPFIVTVRALLVFYVVISGLGFMMGLIQMNHTEMIKRLLKFTFVAVIISPGAWNFLYTNLFQMFIYGPLELIRIFLMGNGSVPGVCIDPNNPASIFKVFDVPFQLIFAEETWMKIGGLALSSISTLPTFIAAVIIFSAAVFIYVLTVAKVMMMYLMSIVILATLIFISPIFICMLLFNFTKFMFDNWWKNLLSFALQPAVMFSVIGIFNLFIIVALNSFLGFETEKRYLIHFSITIDTSKLNIGGPIPPIPSVDQPFNFLPFCAPKYDTSGLSLTALTSAAGGLASQAASSVNTAISSTNQAIGGAETGLSTIGQNLLQEGQQLGNQVGNTITGAGQSSIGAISGAGTTVASGASAAVTQPPATTIAQLQAAADSAAAAAASAYNQTVAQAQADLNAAQAAAGAGTAAAQQALDNFNATVALAASRQAAAIQSSQIALQSAINNSYNALQNTGNTIQNTFTQFNGPASSFGSSALSDVASGINWASNQMTSLINIILNVLVLLIFVHGMYIFTHFTPELVQRIVSGQAISQSSITAVGEKMFTNVVASVSTTAAKEYNASYSVEQTSQRFDKVRGEGGKKR